VWSVIFHYPVIVNYGFAELAKYIWRTLCANCMKKRRNRKTMMTPDLIWLTAVTYWRTRLVKRIAHRLRSDNLAISITLYWMSTICLKNGNHVCYIPTRIFFIKSHIFANFPNFYCLLYLVQWCFWTHMYAHIWVLLIA